MRSRMGLGLTAIRDSESAASSLGVNTQRIKWWVFVIAAFGTGVTGGLIYLNLLRITPDAAFSPIWTAFMIFIVVIGGIGTIEGPILGTLVFMVLRKYLADFGGWSRILLDLVAVFIMLIAPEGYGVSFTGALILLYSRSGGACPVLSKENIRLTRRCSGSKKTGCRTSRLNNRSRASFECAELESV